ncbi:hypothetical protein DACRYDRAFT_112186 [Dacryopinax primogenitus]|uniref:Uncharacterized protein n=1 Tax=Dacryopinax primogenitus (strain DJM 731) TaxID=1858805 RepID=M5G0B8_DACPD|nr:uncharacterized protein DACRYDRAFT_112186 [Dacryopinax primogenitus]EJT97242.1 hypothetical protein DACRYDRAFT_112186 [Dacryopinax primogenitus]
MSNVISVNPANLATSTIDSTVNYIITQVFIVHDIFTKLKEIHMLHKENGQLEIYCQCKPTMSKPIKMDTLAAQKCHLEFEIKRVHNACTQYEPTTDQSWNLLEKACQEVPQDTAGVTHITCTEVVMLQYLLNAIACKMDHLQQRLSEASKMDLNHELVALNWHNVEL